MDKRFFKVCLIVFIIGILWLLLSSPKSYTDKYSIDRYETHTVSSSETLWNICRESCPDAVDIREYIEIVKELSGKENSDIYVGEVLVVPIIEEACDGLGDD